ncbi:MAG: outer membrane lipoprotein-sorting protein [Gammaproteobacteria bacterium]|nr:outer membrane lipoprotein-sorting protein [Gammaproteobacteria bacterium]
MIKNFLPEFFRLGIILISLIGYSTFTHAEQFLDPKVLIRAAMDHWRGVTSYSEMTMVVHRSDWQRRMSMQAWTMGEKTSLVRVTEPKRDAGNGTLIKDQNMWSYSPKVNRILKVPSSMMSQSWLGSDFSNKDISKSTDIIDQYEHSLIGNEEKDGHMFYTIESIPHEDAAVVWGKEVVIVRDDFVLIRQEFWDQDNILIKEMNALEVAEMGGRSVARRIRMNKVETPDEWTEMSVQKVEFDIELNDSLFSLSSLRNPRQ